MKGFQFTLGFVSSSEGHSAGNRDLQDAGWNPAHHFWCCSFLPLCRVPDRLLFTNQCTVTLFLPLRGTLRGTLRVVLRVEWNFGYEITYDTTHTAKCEETVVRAAPTTPPIVAI